jgi:hypothetical protein
MRIYPLTLQDHLQFVSKSCRFIQESLPNELQKPPINQLSNQYFIVNELFSLLIIDITPLCNYEIYIKKGLYKTDFILNELYYLVQSENKETMYQIANNIFNFFEDKILINFICTKDYFPQFYYYYINMIQLLYLLYHDPYFLAMYQFTLYQMSSFLD